MSPAPTIDADRYRAVLGRFVTGVTVVTTLDEPDPVTGAPPPFHPVLARTMALRGKPDET